MTSVVVLLLILITLGIRLFVVFAIFGLEYYRNKWFLHLQEKRRHEHDRQRRSGSDRS